MDTDDAPLEVDIRRGDAERFADPQPVYARNSKSARREPES